MGGDATTIGGDGRTFPATRWSQIRAAGDPRSPRHREALDELCRAYWKPAYAYLRSLRDLSNEDAKDLTQEFLLEAIEGGLLARVPRDGSGFRAYLRGALKLFLLERRRAAGAQKRGGDRTLVSLDDAALVERHSVGSDRTPEQAFDAEWARTLIDRAVDALKQELAEGGRDVVFRVFERYELNPTPDAPTYAAIAAEFRVNETDVTNWLASCRKRLRALIEERIRDTLDSESDLATELLDLFTR